VFHTMGVGRSVHIPDLIHTVISMHTGTNTERCKVSVLDGLEPLSQD
jgi:hypothetical protein